MLLSECCHRHKHQITSINYSANRLSTYRVSNEAKRKELNNIKTLRNNKHNTNNTIKRPTPQKQNGSLPHISENKELLCYSPQLRRSWFGYWCELGRPPINWKDPEGKQRHELAAPPPPNSVSTARVWKSHFLCKQWERLNRGNHIEAENTLPWLTSTIRMTHCETLMLEKFRSHWLQSYSLDSDDHILKFPAL